MELGQFGGDGGGKLGWMVGLGGFRRGRVEEYWCRAEVLFLRQLERVNDDLDGDAAVWGMVFDGVVDAIDIEVVQ